ncbi:MAG: glycosyltransferase family 2 protein [Chloroflexi bacterium]|nr:glycosyltransferase family 2 protein [Chloroflexota bacterium]
MKLSVLVPLYNEDATCVDLLRRVDAVPVEKEIIVVDDGSRRSMAEEIRAALPTVRQFAHPQNRGKGAAIRTALAQATGDVVIIQDADSEYFPEDYVGLIRAYEQQAGAVVYGVRDLSGRDPLMRWGNWFVTFVTNVLFRSRLHDMETCYKLIDRQVMLALDLQGSGFEIEPEITAKLLRLGVPIVETPIRYEARTDGKKLTPMDGLPTVLMLFRCLRWRPAVPVPSRRAAAGGPVMSEPRPRA